MEGHDGQDGNTPYPIECRHPSAGSLRSAEEFDGCG
jgi:hypothetical protein